MVAVTVRTPWQRIPAVRSASGCHSISFAAQLAAGVRLVAVAPQKETLRSLQQFAYAPHVVRDPRSPIQNVREFSEDLFESLVAAYNSGDSGVD